MENKWLSIFSDHHECLTKQTIQDYIHNNLSEEGVRKVESHLSYCQLCDEATDGYIWAKQQKQSPKRFKLVTWIAAAAALTGLLFLLPFKGKEAIRPNAEIAAVISPEEYIALTRFGQTKSSNQDNFEETIMQLVTDAKYKEASEELGKHLTTHTTDLDAQLILGSIQRFEGQYEKAIQSLRPIIETNNDFTNTALWLIAQCYLDMGDQQAAKTQLQVIINNPNSLNYQEKAKKLLKNLD